MQQGEEEKRQLSTGLWLLVVACTAVIVFVLCTGAAYTAVQRARLSAARAGIGRVEAVLLLAEKQAEDAGLGAPPATYSHLLKSYEDANAGDLTEHEKYVLNAMLDALGPGRDFDFAVTRYGDASGTHLEIYYFPSLGRTDPRADRYYHARAGEIIAGG